MAAGGEIMLADLIRTTEHMQCQAPRDTSGCSGRVRRFSSAPTV